MKKLMHNFLYVGLLLAGLNFTACQDEFEEIGGVEDQETIIANSNTAQLIEKTSSQDGSYDNIVDKASCFAVKFPYTVEVNGIQITIDSKEDLHTIEEIFDEIDDDDDILDIIFPITITLSDFSEIVIENFDQLEEMARDCLEGGDDDDIECIDFVYPITLFNFDVNNQVSGEVKIESDEQMRKFFAELEDDALVSIDFPITLKKYDGTEIVVENNASLAAALSNAKDDCDEDDDDDYNDDDFSKERLDAYLVECPWEVREVIRNEVDQTGQYFEYLMTFSEDGAVVVKVASGNTLNGTWSTTQSDHGPVLALEFDTLVDFNLEWVVYEVGEGKIKLYAESANRIILKQRCDINPGEEPDPDTLRAILGECEWIIKKVKNQGEEIERLLGYEFKFMAEGVVTLSNGVSTSEGTWEIGLNSQLVMSLMITMGDEPGVNFEWPLRDLANDRLKFEVEDIGYELILQRVCDDNADDEDVAEIRNIMMGGPWMVAQYTENNEDLTSEYATMEFNFDTMHQVGVSINDDSIAEGLWRVLRNHDGVLKFYLNLGAEGSLGELTEDWYINMVEANRIELVHEQENSTEILVFEKP
ncbi:hypothetical protein EZV76_05745 [Flagellimonas alvinocaridis]|uniref:Uncharacterized protein n=1 Tax=Flagellimonas alvinocaridis TaxID=2530200 RepID=A0A4S8S0C8_9FLAO|nr:hypothetical protein [Allomuricauda alvinocaridis]THV60064.1 hypothetical protein EZV76_05745 [Allomuricauda alvinocaridis]